MAQPRYSDTLKNFIQQWRPNDLELDKRFVQAVRELVEAILKPPTSRFEVETILTEAGGKVVVRLADYEAQLEVLDAQHLALSLVEAATSARTESWLYRFLLEQTGAEQEIAGRIIAQFRHYRVEEMEKELAGDFARRSLPPKGGA